MIVVGFIPSRVKELFQFPQFVIQSEGFGAEIQWASFSLRLVSKGLYKVGRNKV